MKTIFPKKEYNIPKWYILDATNKTLGRLSTEASKLLRGKENSYFTPHIDQGNFVIILNANKINISGNKDKTKFYYKTTQRPGNLKKESFIHLKQRLPYKILEKAIWGMLPKGILGRLFYKRLYIFNDNKIHFLKNKEKDINNFINFNLK